jgi:hypothetical protein
MDTQSLNQRFRKKGRNKKQTEEYKIIHERIQHVLEKNSTGLSRKEILKQAKIGSRRTLRKHLKQFQSTELIKENEGIIFWKLQHDRLQAIEKLIESFTTAMQQQINTQLIEEKISTRFTSQEIANHIINNQVLIFIPMRVTKGDTEVNYYDLTYVELADFENEGKFEIIWNRMKERRELRKKGLTEKI